MWYEGRVDYLGIKKDIYSGGWKDDGGRRVVRRKL